MGGIYYVYEHWRPDKGECFYVGKGRGNRATSVSHRNAHHKAIQAKLARLGMCVEVRMVSDGLTEEEAFRLEVSRIAFWRADGADLANRTDGGEGGSNPSAETRAKMRAAKLGKKRQRTAEHNAKIAAALTGRKLSPQHAEKARTASLGRKQRQEEVEHRRAANKGRKRSAEFRALMSSKWTPERKAELSRITTERNLLNNPRNKIKMEN